MIQGRVLKRAGVLCLWAVAASAQTPSPATAPAEDQPAGKNSVVIRWPEAPADGKPASPVRFPATFTPESLQSFLRNNLDRLPLTMKPESEREAVAAALAKIDMGVLLEAADERLTSILGKPLDFGSNLIVEAVPEAQQITIDLADLKLKPYVGPKQLVKGFVAPDVTEAEYVALALELMEKARQLMASGDAYVDRTSGDHLKAIAEHEVAALRADQEKALAVAAEKEAARKHVGELLGVYNPTTKKFDGEAKWVKESRRFTYVVNAKSGQFIDRLKPAVDKVNREMDLAGFPGPAPLDKPGVHFDPNLGDVEVVLPKALAETFLAETDALEQRMAEKLTIGIEAVRLTDRDIVNGAVAARLSADMLGVHNADYGYSSRGVLRRVGINALTAIANQQLQIQQLNSVAAGSWPAATPLVTLETPGVPPLQTTKTWTAVGGNWSVGADPIFFDGRQQTFGLTYYDPNGVQHTLGLDVVDSLRMYWNRIERNLIVHKIKKDPLVPLTKFTVPVGPSTNTFEGLAALISQEDQNLIVATGTGAISQISAKAGTWLVIQDFQITPLPGSSTSVTEEELNELRLKTLLTMFLRDPNTEVARKTEFLESPSMDGLHRLLTEQLAQTSKQPVLKGPRSRTYNQVFEQRYAEAQDSAAVRKKEENMVISLTFYSSQGNIIQSPGATQLGSANDLTALTTELRPNTVTPISSFVLKTLENTESKSPLTNLNKGESSDESKTMAHLLVRARFPTVEREKHDVEEGRQLGYFKLPLEREPLSTTSLPFLSSSDHPLERLASFRVGAMFESLQASKIRRHLSLSEPNVLDGSISERTWKLATARMMINFKLIGDSPGNISTLAPHYRQRFIVAVRSLLEYDADFFDEPKVALRTMYEWNDAHRIVEALNNSPERFALQRLVKMIDELGQVLVPDSYAEESLAVSEYHFLEGHRLRPLTEAELRCVRRDVGNHFLRESEAYGDAFMDAVSMILGLGVYSTTKAADLEKAPLDGYQDLVLFDRGGRAEHADAQLREKAHEHFITLRNGGFKGKLFQPSMLVVEHMPAEERTFVVSGEDLVH